jgi:hypothetical protein
MQDRTNQLVEQIVQSPQWTHLKEYLTNLQHQTTRELAMAQSEQEVFRKQGKWNLLEQLIQLDKTNTLNKQQEK